MHAAPRGPTPPRGLPRRTPRSARRARPSPEKEGTDDLVVGRHHYDAFLHTDLEPVLRAPGADRLVVGGVLTNHCVESTVRSGVERGFDTSVAADRTAASAQFHGPSLAGTEAVFATAGPWNELPPAP